MGAFKIFDISLLQEMSEKKINDLYVLNNILRRDINDKLKTIEPHQKYIEIGDGRIIKAGHIILRPLKGKKDISDLGFNHYAIVLGTSRIGEKLLVDINDERNVDVDTFEKFKLDFGYDKIMEEKNNVDLDLILERVIEMQFACYYVDVFNCRQFVTYCVYGKKYSEAVELSAIIVYTILGFWIMKREITNFRLQNNEANSTDFIKAYSKITDYMKAINENIKKILDEIKFPASTSRK